MEESNLYCELSLMYAVVRGMCSILEEDNKKLRDVGSLELGAIDCGAWYLRDQMDRLWEELREKI